MTVLTALTDALDDARFLDAVARPIQGQARALVDNDQLDAVLGGEWLGHPVHPAASQVPLGTLAAATLLDVINSTKYADAVDLLTNVGVATAVPTALTGVHDWADTSGAAGRTGLVHAAAMDTALVLFVAAIVARKWGDRRKGRRLALAGLAVAGTGGFLGGHLAYVLGVGQSSRSLLPFH